MFIAASKVLSELEETRLAMTAYWFSKGYWGYRAYIVLIEGRHVIASNLNPGGYTLD